MTVPLPRPAATVVLLKPSPTRFDVCLIRRHDEVAFMGGAYVFPGGRLDAADRLADPEACCDGLDEAARRLSELPCGEAIAHYVGAIREMFEEAGVLIARPAPGVVWPTAGSRAALAAQREALADGASTMGQVAAALDVRLACDALVYFAHWRTPESEAKRYDVRFFLASAPDGQEPAHDGHEATESLWIDPAGAVERCRRGEMLLAPPTWTTLRTLERFASIEEALAWGRTRRPVVVQPMLFEVDAARMLALPGDELYPPIAEFETPRETRFAFANGRWRPIER